MGVTLAAADAMNWLNRMLQKSPAELDSRLPDQPNAPCAAHFLPYLPYLSGERTPHNDADIRGSFVGLDIAHSSEDLTMAAMQGVCFALRDSFDALEATGAQMDHLLAVGGGTQSSYWLHTLASVLNVPLMRPANGELGAALGAVRLAMVGDGHSITDTMTQPEIAQVVEPNPDLSAAYDAPYAQYRALYTNIKAALA